MGQFDGILGLLSNPGISAGLSDLGAGLLSAPNWKGGFQQAGLRATQMEPYRQEASQLRQDKTLEAAKQNQTAAYFRKIGRNDIATAIELGQVDGGAAFKEHWQRQAAEKKTAEGGPTTEDPATVREWQYFSGLNPEQQGAYLRMKRANPYLDIGTGFASPDPINPGQTVGPAIVKENFTEAFDTASGTAKGKTAAEIQAEADSLSSKLPGLKTVIGELGELAKTATYTATGQVIDSAMREAGMEPSAAAVARTKYIAMVDNQVLPLLRDTFGAAFTVKEGETLRATLGDPNKSPTEKQAILEAFIEQKMRDLEAMQSRLSPAGGQQQPTSGGVVDYSTYFGGQ